MLKFISWLATLNEIKFEDLQEVHGYEASPEQMLGLYILYYQAYNSEGLTPWRYDDWAGIRAGNWTFLGVLPKVQDLSSLKAILVKHNGDEQSAADEVFAGPDASMMGYAGGISYRDPDGKSFKITSSWGMNPIAKMRAAADLIKKANESEPPREIFTAADNRLKQLIQNAEEKMPKLHAKGLVSVPSLGLSTPPKSLVPILYKAITRMPGASGHGTWTGFEPETGALKMNLKGAGDVKKFVFGNKALWKNHLTRELERTGHLDKIMQAKKLIDGGGMLGWGAKKAVLLAINAAVAKMTEDPSVSVDEEGLMWLLSQVG
jgi:hypothetical protein